MSKFSSPYLSNPNTESVGISTFVSLYWLPGITGPSPSASLDKSNIYFMFHLLFHSIKQSCSISQLYFLNFLKLISRCYLLKIYISTIVIQK